MRFFSRTLCGALAATQAVNALQLDVSSPASIKAAAGTVAYGLMDWYKGNLTGGIPGLLPGPYYWWQAGAMFGSMVEYWYYTGDPTYNPQVIQALQFQVGPDDNYMPPNQSKSLGNDDQAFWGMAAMSAAEFKFQNPPADQPQWLALAQAVFNSQALRWDTSTCGGGLRWQIYTFNNGYNYKNSISNGCFFNIATRLGAYTKNATFFDWADRMFDWVSTIGLVNGTASPGSLYVYDGSDDLLNCTEFDHVQWTYNAGIFMHGCAVMWNQTTGATQARWEARVQQFMTGLNIFFKDTVMFEVACEPQANCNNDQKSFKAYLSRWMAQTIKVAPWTRPTLYPLLQSSAQAAAKACSGGNAGTTCGMKWTTGTYDGDYGPGQQMSALEVIQANLLDAVAGPVSNLTGGTSTGNNLAGTGGDRNPLAPLKTISTGDRAGAGILTAIIIVSLVGTAWWMVA